MLDFQRYSENQQTDKFYSHELRKLHFMHRYKCLMVLFGVFCLLYLNNHSLGCYFII